MDNTKIADNYNDYFNPSKETHASVSTENVPIFSGMTLSSFAFASATLGTSALTCASWGDASSGDAGKYGAAAAKDFHRLHS